MEDDQDAVFCAAHVHFKNIDAEGEGLLKSVEGILGPKTPSASMGDHFHTVFALGEVGMIFGGFC